MSKRLEILLETYKSNTFLGMNDVSLKLRDIEPKAHDNADAYLIIEMWATGDEILYSHATKRGVAEGKDDVVVYKNKITGVYRVPVDKIVELEQGYGLSNRWKIDCNTPSSKAKASWWERLLSFLYFS